MSKVILDHNEPARLACDSSPQKTFMARLHAQSHPEEISPKLQAELDASLRQAEAFGKVFDVFLNKLTGGPGK